MTSVSLRGMRPAPGVGGLAAPLAAAVGLVGVAGVGMQLGPVPTVAGLLLAVLGVFLLAHPGWAVFLVVAVLIGAEADAEWGVPIFAELYKPTPVVVNPFEVLMLVAIAAVVLDGMRPGVGFRSLAPFGLALYMVVFALVFGTVYGKLGGDSIQYIVTSTFQTTLPLVVLPFLIVNVVRTREQLRRVIMVVPVVALVKALAGLAVSLGGLGAVSEGIGILTYYKPTSNYFLMLFLLGMLAFSLRRVDTGMLARWTVPVVVLCLTLSYRRTFWLATIACVLILLVLGSGQELRRMLPIIAILTIAAGYATLTGGLLGSDSPVVQRAESLSPDRVSRNEQDRYRIAERKNVLLALEKEPLTGLGVGVEWKTRYPVPFEGDNLHSYAHLGILWWWLRAGLLGGLAYVLVIGTTFWAGVRLSRRHPDKMIAAASLAAGVSILGMLVVELASSVIGPDERGTAIVGCTIVLLAVAWADMRRSGPSSAVAA